MTFTDYHRKKRYKDWLDPPQVCDCCGEPLVVLVNNTVVYGRPCGDWPWIYLCMSCEAFVGCHPYSVFPLGRMADRETRQMRRQLHAMIDPLWNTPAMSRGEVYSMMAKMMGTPTFHIGELSREECLRANQLFRTWETAVDFDDPPW
ncbi:Phage protein [Xanthomonas phage Bosa]|uniref:Phage protein n=1 Tax=Xanthomonas phage Bosa TaxID=2674976 RepID=A0A679KLM4_9CAUD|nr:Phage protein [Xanthomonas phage Bosa]CAA2409919.1 Phage protein [Xanthomonas phage Bosa]